jgi:signal transduction protein with GAF and PtsI domain
MKQTAIQQAITIVRSRMESMNDTLMGKHTIHHLQQVERRLYDLLEEEKEQMNEAYKEGYFVLPRDVDFKKYYEETYGKK